MSPSDDPIAADAERLVEEWRAACRIPSVSGEREPIEEMAAWVEQGVARRFDRVVVERTPDGVPIVLGELRGAGPGRLIVYSHYDVVPAGDPAAWDSDPFAAELRGGAVYARGTCDDKADVTARLQAIDLWLDANDGAPPVTLLWVCEGAEEVGSPGLAAESGVSAGRSTTCVWAGFR